MIALQQLNALDQPAFTAALAHIFEHSPWIPERTWQHRPFQSLDDLHQKLLATVAAAPEADKLSLLRAHPDLVGKLARENRLTKESTAEQNAAGLTALSPDEVAAFETSNAAYRKKFDFPFIICARENKKDAILAAFPQRLANSRGAEIRIALAEVGKIARLRLLDTLKENPSMARLSRNYYGKDHVRLTKLVRGGDRHALYEFSVKILLEGAFERVYTQGDNSACVPTDTMKNTVYALGKKHDFDSPEAFALLLSAHFLEEFSHVSAVAVTVEQILWDRIIVDDRPHEHAFQKSSNALRTATVHQDRTQPPTVTGGITSLEVIKTARSAFTGFMTDPYTTLNPTSDRLLGTSIDAAWTFAAPDAPFNEAFDAARNTILSVFATHDSRGVQHTLYAMGEAALAAIPSISSIAFTLPNAHRILVNLAPFNLTNDNDIFVSTAEPFGLIHGTVTRE
jgi:urate oxidase